MKRDAEKRQGHAVLDLHSRNFKAMKIAHLLGVSPGSERRRMLEVGCGSGGISHWFGTDGAMGWDVEAVDVEDTRLVHEGFVFRTVADTRLPFPDASFDVVVSNHVIEHVGNADAQREHLRELRRVLDPGGVAYLALPNRWMIVEPHFNLPFLSWLPRRIADVYVRATRKGCYYDCRPLAAREVEFEFKRTGFSFVQAHGEALRLTYELECPDSPVYRWVLRRVPDAIYSALRRTFPTLIYVLRPLSGRPA